MSPHPIRSNLFDLPADFYAPPTGPELFETLLSTPGLKVERILSRGHTTPDKEWYDQDQDEWVILLQGQATLLFDDDSTTDLGPGDYLLIPAHTRHRVIHTSTEPPCVWLAIHFSPTG